MESNLPLNGTDSRSYRLCAKGKKPLQKADGWYIAHCPPLDVTTQGKTLAEAKRNLIEASELFIISCLERGTLDLALRELGFVGPIKGRIPAMPANAFSFPVPIPLRFQRRSAAAECLA